MKKARTLFCSTRSQTHSPSESYARWRRLEPLGFARRQRPPCKRDADPSGLKADREGDHVANVLGWLRMRQTKTYWHRKTARSEFRAEPQQPGPAYGACPCRNLHHYSHAHRSMEAYFAGAASCSAHKRHSLASITPHCSFPRPADCAGRSILSVGLPVPGYEATIRPLMAVRVSLDTRKVMYEWQARLQCHHFRWRGDRRS